MIRVSLFSCALLLALPVVSAEVPKGQQAVNPPVVLESTQIFTIRSEARQQDYRIQVRLPGSYETNLSKKYPLIIKVDGQWDFPLASSVFNGIYFDGQMPETIIIGIDWGDVGGNVQAIRARDLLPAPMQGFENSGQAEQFINTLASEIIPELAQRFRLNGQEFLLGGSWGATFATYALLERPDVFDGAIAIAGDYTSAADKFDQQMKTAAKSNALEGKRLYIGVGKGDSVAPKVVAYAKKLKAAKLKGFDLKVDVLDGFGHSGMNIPGYAGGYQFMFERPRVAVDQKILKQLAGNYTATEKGWPDLSISVKSKNLLVSIRGETIQMLAKSEQDFYHPDRFFNLTFDGATARVETFFSGATYKKALENRD